MNNQYKISHPLTVNWNPISFDTRLTSSKLNSIDDSLGASSKWYKRGPIHDYISFSLLDYYFHHKAHTNVDPGTSLLEDLVDSLNVGQDVGCRINKEASHHHIPCTCCISISIRISCHKVLKNTYHGCSHHHHILPRIHLQPLKSQPWMVNWMAQYLGHAQVQVVVTTSGCWKRNARMDKSRIPQPCSFDSTRNWMPRAIPDKTTISLSLFTFSFHLSLP